METLPGRVRESDGNDRGTRVNPGRTFTGRREIAASGADLDGWIFNDPPAQWPVPTMERAPGL